MSPRGSSHDAQVVKVFIVVTCPASIFAMWVELDTSPIA